MLAGKVRVAAREKEIERIVYAPATSEPVARTVVQILCPCVSVLHREAVTVPFVQRDLERVVSRIVAVHPPGYGEEVFDGPAVVDVRPILCQ